MAAAVGDEAAADIAAAALLDTLDAVAGTPFAARVVALTGDLSLAARSAQIRSRLDDFIVIGQRGADFGHRLAHAHADAAAVGAAPVLQIGMDTPQVTAELLTDCAGKLAPGTAVLGPAHDGGWWLLGVSDASLAGCLIDVPMSQSDTGALTAAALERGGVQVVLTTELADVDTVADIPVVRTACRPASRFTLATEGI
ncbi:MAG: TIGR04282 family arsenosugar biosynthesis glycosyltransferase [Mycobacterium sp.]